MLLEFIKSKIFSSRKWGGNSSRELVPLHRMCFFVFQQLGFATEEKIKVTNRSLAFVIALQ